MRTQTILLLALAWLLAACARQPENERFDLRSLQWTLHDTGDSIRLTGVRPDDVHLALMEKGIIDDPFFGTNEQQVQWVGEKDWVFETRFNVPENLLRQERLELVFEGLDTYAEVFLNGREILRTDNMFRRWNANVKSLLKQEQNTLRIVFRSPVRINREKQSNYPFRLPEQRAFTRKAAYQFGWDWGPRLVTMGVWKPAFLEGWSNQKVRDVYIRQLDVSAEKARLRAELEVETLRQGPVNLQVKHGRQLLADTVFALQKGMNKLTLPFVVENPDLWWPNGMGEPNLYDFTVKLDRDGKTVFSTTLLTGLRKIELVQQPDSIGKSFYFKVNGKAVFIKGANFVPPDNFLSRVPESTYRQLIQTAISSHMNMLRVWGGGTYVDEAFYRLCDENGILVWQDFMFAGTVYPGDASFLETVAVEARQNVQHLRNHPCIALWCGNNEIDEAWHNWGWQKSLGYSPSDSAEIWQAYLHLFEELLPAVVRQYHPGAAYIPSSPATGWGREEAYRQGDVHYWGVWWGKEPFSAYRTHTGRFVSEYGFQSLPAEATVKAFTLPEDRQLGSPVLDAHQKHPFGWENIQTYMERNYPVPDNLEDYIYVSQLLQADGLKTAIEAHRRARPVCMGSLYWQLNDCWPVTSWSTVDYYGRWKAGQYAVKESSRMCLVTFADAGDGVEIYAVTDDYRDKSVGLKWTLRDFSGKVLQQDSLAFFLPAVSSVKVTTLEKKFFPWAAQKPQTVLSADLWYGNNMLYRGLYYFAKPKDLRLESPAIRTELKKLGENWVLQLTAEKLAKSVFIDCDDRFRCEDNFFDLLPGEQRKVVLLPRTDTSETTDPPEFSVKSLWDVKTR